MNIYLVTRKDDGYLWYDTYDSFVCTSENEENAKEIHPSGGNIFDKENYGWVENIDDLTVSLIGISECKEEHVVLSSFNAA